MRTAACVPSERKWEGIRLPLIILKIPQVIGIEVGVLDLMYNIHQLLVYFDGSMISKNFHENSNVQHGLIPIVDQRIHLFDLSND